MMIFECVISFFESDLIFEIDFISSSNVWRTFEFLSILLIIFNFFIQFYNHFKILNTVYNNF